MTSDDEIRAEILVFLKEKYDENPNQEVMKNSFLEDGGFNLEELERNIRYLRDKHFISVNWFLGGVESSGNIFHAKITSWGIDAVEEYERTSSQNTGTQKLVNGLKFSWKAIVAVLILLGLIAGAINDWETISQFINSSLP